MHKHPPLCVLGMHRSGTSLVTGILKLLGLYLGPESHLIPANYGNPTGFWEHQQCIQLNNQMLATLGGTWHEPPPFLPGWEHAPEIADIRQQTQDFLRREFPPSRHWGWKDPRTCLTAPVWKQLVPNLQFVVCVRNPLDVAHSLHSRDGFSFAKSIQLWLQYTTAALTHSIGHPRLLIFYEDCIEHPHTAVERLANFLGQPDVTAQPSSQEAVHEFIDTALQHHRNPVLDVTPETRITVLARALYLALKIYASVEEHSNQAASDEAARVQQLLLHFASYCQQAQADLDHAEHQAQQEIARLSQLTATHQEAHSHTQAELTAIRTQLTTRTAELETLQQTLTDTHGQLTIQQAERTALQHTLTQVQGRLTVRESEHTALQQSLTEAQEHAANQEHDIQVLRQQLTHEQVTAHDTTHQLGQWQRKAMTLATQLETFRQRRLTRWLARIRPGQDLSAEIDPAFQQLKDDSLLFTPDLRGFRLQPSANLARVPFLAYPLNVQHKNLSGVLLAVSTDLPLKQGEFGIEIVSPAQTIVAQSLIACTEIEEHVPTCLVFSAVPDSDHSELWLRVFVRAATTPIRIFEWQKYVWGGLGYLQTRAFCGFLFE